MSVYYCVFSTCLWVEELIWFSFSEWWYFVQNGGPIFLDSFSQSGIKLDAKTISSNLLN